jgi:hypothetical protein
MSAQSRDRDGQPDLVRTLQSKLKYLGYYQGPCDGVANTGLDQAIVQFCSKHKIKERPGYVDALDRIDAVEGYTFADVLRTELDALRTGDPPPTPASDDATPGDEAIRRAHQAGLAGLALSGGGIRSATFNLGILQALASARLLAHFDYLSTVSGGGYIGGWLSKWIHRCGDVALLQESLAQSGKRTQTRREPVQVTFLRQYSNYLTPRVGLFTADTWSFFATYLRNTMLNFLILSLFLASALVVPRVWVSIVGWMDDTLGRAFLALGSGMFLLAVHQIAFAISCRQGPSAKVPLSQAWVLRWIVIPLVLSAMFGSAGLWQVRAELAHVWTRDTWPLILLVPGSVYFLAWATGWDRAQHYGRNAGASAPLRKRAGARLQAMHDRGLPHLFCAIGAFAVGTAIILTMATALEDAGSTNIAHVACFGTPALLAVFGVTVVLMIGLIGRYYSDQSREWWSRQGGWTFICVIGSTGLFLFSLYGPALAMWVHVNAGAWASALLASGWLGAAWATLRAARNPKTGKPGKNPLLRWLVRFGPPLVMGLVLVAISTAIYLVFAQHFPIENESFLSILQLQMTDALDTFLQPLALAMFLCLTGAFTLAYRVDVNKFSLYMMYRNRLVRSYLGAIDAGKRRPHPFTGFDPQDDLALAQLGMNGKVQRPYLIVNAALNLVKGNELAWQTRKAANFTFTPRFCGYETPPMPVSRSSGAQAESARGGYRPTAQYAAISTDPDPADKGVKLGMAMAISGAAVASSMGAFSSASLAFMMTMFNVRLGRWCGNPAARDDSWRRASPPAGLAHLFREMFGFTDAASPYLYLSDGGHFENLGIYELVRRRCRLVVAIDASADRELHFADLGNAIRKCYTDFNIEIDVNVKDLELAANSSFSSAYYAVGKILYGAVDPTAPDGTPAPDGTLLYIKPSLMGTELAGITNYYLSNPDFPHQSTADQWFDETQFESYRSLGQHIGHAVFAGMQAQVKAAPGTVDAVQELCTALEGSARTQQRKRSYPWWHARHWL